MGRIRGCPIPDSAETVTRAICFPASWAGLLSDLLLPPTEIDFWDRFANEEDRDSATQIASVIVHDFLSDECQCVQAGETDTITWDFETTDGGFETPGSGYGTYVSTEGWHADIVQTGASQWEARLVISLTLDAPVFPEYMKITTFIQDDATTHLAASYAMISLYDASNTLIADATAQYGGDLLGWHIGPINPSASMHSSLPGDYLRIRLTATYALDPTGVVDMYVRSATLSYKS